MRIKELRIENYKIFKTINILFNDNVNIFVGENDSGKTTILEALSMVHPAQLIRQSTLRWKSAAIEICRNF